MPSLKDLRVRIDSVKATQKITSAMKMVAASKLRKAEVQVKEIRPYARAMAGMIARLKQDGQLVTDLGDVNLLNGREQTAQSVKDDASDAREKHLIVVATSDRGLCGGFNSSMIRQMKFKIRRMAADGINVKVLCLGRKGREILKRECPGQVVDSPFDISAKNYSLEDARAFAEHLWAFYMEGAYDRVSITFNAFQSVISQTLTVKQLIPVQLDGEAAFWANEERATVSEQTSTEGHSDSEAKGLYLFEPSEGVLLGELLEANLATQLYWIVRESRASEQGARMSAMDSATRNAGEMIDRLTLTYNRTRQAMITKELIEILSGAEAL